MGIEHYEGKQKVVNVTACLHSKQDVEKLIEGLAIIKEFLPEKDTDKKEPAHA